MRSLLYRYKDVSPVLTGVVETICKDRDKTQMIMLLKDVRLRGSQITDHLWTRVAISHLKKHWFSIGSTIRFSGKVVSYLNKSNKINYGINQIYILSEGDKS